MKPWLVPIVLLLLAAAAVLGGWTWVALACGVACLVALVMDLRSARSRPSAPAPDLTADEAAAVRSERERAGEVAAVRLLRARRSGLSLVDAVRLVRAA